MKNHSAFLEAILPYLGLIYFTAWSVSFYPQLLLNYRRKRYVTPPAFPLSVSLADLVDPFGSCVVPS